MAVYRNIQLSFWTDNKVEDDFTPEDKYFFLYLLTNPQTNICGCYEVSYSQMTNQTGYNKETINRLLDRFEKIHNVIRYDKETKEILILNWHKYNWSKSKDTLRGVKKVSEHIKSSAFRKYVLEVISCIENNTPIRGSIDPREASVTDTDTDTVTDTVTVTVTEEGVKDTKARESQNGKKTPPKAEDRVYFPNDEKLNEAFVEYVKMRKVIKKPMTDHAIDLAIKKLRNMSTLPRSDTMDNNLAIEILNQSVMNCWQGLFPLSDGTRGRSSTYSGQTAQMLENHYSMVDDWVRKKEMEEGNGDV